MPSDAGVTFEGFEEFKIKGRESVRQGLENFIEYCKGAKKPAIRIILGEWGEGKTDAYSRYIVPRSQVDGNHAFFVSASTLSNGYENPRLTKLLRSTSSSAVKFLVVLFDCVREESQRADVPSPEGYEDAYAYLNAVLKMLIGNKKARRIFVFIDEFEELLLNQLRLKDIISGIKETINGMFSPIDEGGEYEGCLHLIVAATPDAYYKLEVDEETALIFGGLGRRAGVIELPLIRKHEGVEFLFALLKYSYKNLLPEPLPFDSLGIFQLLFKIAQGNLGNMVSLFTRLMNSAMIDQQHIKKIDGEHLLKFLEKERISVYGGTTPCLETETFFRFLKIAGEQKVKETGEQCVSLLKTMVGELKPFSTKEIEQKIRRSDVRNIINIVNDNLRNREGIERAILKVSPLKEGKSFREVQEAFKEYITMEKDKKHIKIDNYSESLEDFEDRITYFSFDGNKINSEIFLPSEKHSIMSFFEGISYDRAVELENHISRKLCRDEDYYLASDELLSQIFPTPVPRELEFIKDRELRMKLWREVTRNLAEQYETYMPTAFMKLLENSGLYRLKETERRIPQSLARFAELVIDEIKINALFYSINGDVKSLDIEDLSGLIRSTKPPIQCLVLLYTGEVTQEAEDKIINKELGKDGENLILDVHVHPTLAKRIICIHKASLKTREIDQNLFASVIRRIVTSELDFENKLKDWLDLQEKKGILIRDLPIEATSNLREFADALKFYINFAGEEHSVQEVFAKNRELLAFIRYEAKKVRLIPDIELPKFEKLTEDLANNGFLSRSKNRYKLQFHPVEDRILRILEREKKLSDTELEGFFILKSKRFLWDVFLPILEYKGLIRRESNNYLLNDIKALSTEIDRELRKLAEIAESREYQEYGYIYMTKEREYRFITLEKFHKFITSIYQQTKELMETDQRKALQKLSLLNRLTDHFLNEFLPLLKSASEKAKDVLADTRTFHLQIKEKFEQVKKECNKWIKTEFQIENINEYKDIEEINKRIEEYVKYGGEELAKIVEGFDENEKKVFYFRKEDEEAYYFNPKLYLMCIQKEELKETVSRVGQTLTTINEKFQILNKQQEQVERKIKEKIIDEQCKLSHSVLRILKELAKDIFPDAQSIPYESISIEDIYQSVDQNLPQINQRFKDLSECIQLLEGIESEERSFLSALEEGTNLGEHVLSIFDLQGYDEIAKNFNSLIEEVTEKYNKNLGSVSLEDTASLLQKLRSLRSALEQLTERIRKEIPSLDEKWYKYAQEKGELIANMEYLEEILQKYYKIDVTKIKANLSKLQEIIYTKQLRNVKLRLSEIEQIKEEAHKKFQEVIKTVLEEKELQLLELLVKKTRAERAEWIPIHELQKIAEKELDLQQEETNQILRKLIEQRVLKEGISLAF